ncbi:putative mitochondrial protein [Cucumis melo var. makuwa]|uniref:Mitochondrial protein n=1 Tax=Cucumis melo var. makuwa TaxID=1194695 RepID=A0A5D3B9H1_CUCMM|nr:putative mitochondrial protein [Cucumis melo var. makuwa]TYJ95516.1 putative mitochondrial protein [Cucumis melo var. makuwa]
MRNDSMITGSRRYLKAEDIIYVAQPKGFVDSEFPQYVYKIKQISECIFISQEKYAKNIVKKFGLDQSQYKRTLAAAHAKITKDSVGTAVDHKLYRSMIGSLLYLTTSRPDIAYAVGICARYQSDPCISHLIAIKRIIKYVHGTTYFKILYSYDTSSVLVGYCDADWAGSADDRKSTSGINAYLFDFYGSSSWSERIVKKASGLFKLHASFSDLQASSSSYVQL